MSATAGPSYTIALQMDLRQEAPEGAGWYYYVMAGKNMVGQPRRLSSKTALTLAALIAQGLASSPPVEGEPGPVDIVQSGNQLITRALREQIEFAEDQARRIAQLRRTLDAESSVTVSDDVRCNDSDHRG